MAVTSIDVPLDVAAGSGYDEDVQALLANFVAEHGTTASFAGFKLVWRVRTCS